MGNLATIHFNHHWSLGPIPGNFYLQQAGTELITIEEPESQPSYQWYEQLAGIELIVEEIPELQSSYTPIWLEQAATELATEELAEVSTAPSIFTISASANTSLLIHSDTFNNSTVFSDSGYHGHAVTAGGNAKHDTSQSVFGASSMRFDGTLDSLSVPMHSSFQFGSGLFTIDTRIRFSSTTNTYARIIEIGAGPQYSFTMDTNAGGNGLRVFTSNNGSTLQTVSITNLFVINTWYHVAVVRDGNTLRVFVDGSQVGTLDLTGITLHTTTTTHIGIGAMYGGGNSIDGWLDEFRILKGVAAWTTNFTPPTTAYTF